MINKSSRLRDNRNAISQHKESTVWLFSRGRWVTLGGGGGGQ
jgi:hypothetical protein